MTKIKYISLVCLIIFLCIVPFTHAFLDGILDILNGISDALNQLEVLTQIRDFEQTMSDIAEFEEDIRELQRVFTNSVSSIYRWYYFTTGIKNQNLDSLVKTYVNNKPSEYDHVLNMMYGGYGSIRGSKEYSETADNITTMLGKVRTSDNADKDPDTFSYLNNVIAATDNLNQSGNMSHYESQFAGKMDNWSRDCSRVVNSEHTSTEALLKCIINYNVYMIDFHKGQFAYYQAQMRKNYADSYTSAQIVRDSINERRSNVNAGKYIFEKYFKYKE